MDNIKTIGEAITALPLMQNLSSTPSPNSDTGDRINDNGHNDKTNGRLQLKIITSSVGLVRKNSKEGEHTSSSPPALATMFPPQVMNQKLLLPPTLPLLLAVRTSYQLRKKKRHCLLSAAVMKNHLQAGKQMIYLLPLTKTRKPVDA